MNDVACAPELRNCSSSTITWFISGAVPSGVWGDELAIYAGGSATCGGGACLASEVEAMGRESG